MEQPVELTLILQSLQAEQSYPHRLAIDPAIHWPLFYRLLIRHRVWHQIQRAVFFTTQNPPIPSDTDATTMAEAETQLAQFCQKDKLRILTTAAETARIAQAFNQDTLHYCVIKGIVLNTLIYAAIDTRPCRDVDIWVNLDDYHDAILKLQALGYQKTLPNYELTGFKARYYMSHKHDMAFYHPGRKILVELHFRLSYFGIHFFVPTRSMLKTIPLFNTPVSTLDDNYHLLYLMIHGSIHAWIRLRWLHDIALFIKSHRCNLHQVMHLAKHIHCEHIVKQSLILVHDLFKLDDETLAPLIQNPSRRVITLTRLAKQFIVTDYVMTEGVRNIKMFFKYRYYLMRLAVKRQKINAVLSDLFKIDELFQETTFSDKLSFMYYVLYVGWVMKFVWRSRRTQAKS